MMKKFEFLLLFLNIILMKAEIGYLKQGADWGGICSNGTQQSPIDINTDNIIKCDPNMMIDIRWSNSNITNVTHNLGETFKIFGNFSTIYASDFDGDVYGYDALQFHFHSPSEHTINGIHTDLEMHVVHQLRNEFLGETVRILVALGILFNVDDSVGDNIFFTNYDPTLSNSETLNMSYLLSNQTTKPVQYYLYPGSLTTPPCSEIVSWYVLSNPLKMSSQQLAKFKNAWSLNATFAAGNGNNRLTQALNSRSVKIGGLSINACKEDFVSFFGFFVLFLFLIYVIFQVVP